MFVHPTVPKSSEAIPTDVPGFAAEFTFDTSRAALNLIWTGTVTRFPRIRWILSHAGGTTPFLAWRWSLLDLHPTIRERAPEGVMHHLRRFHYDTALSANPHALRSLTELVDPSQILFGSDYWKGLTDWLVGTMEAEAKISPTDMDLIHITDDPADVVAHIVRRRG